MKQKNNKMLSNALAVILTVVVFLVVWKVLLPSYSDNKTKQSKLSSEVSDAQAEILSIENAKSDLSSITNTINQLLVAIPSDRDEPNLISELEAIAAKNTLVLPSIDISKDSGGTGETASAVVTTGIPLSVSFSVTGPFANIGTFTESLEKSIKYMKIKSITMSYVDPNNISAAYSIETFTRADNSTTDNSTAGAQ